jgi:hypothetical protein
MTASIRDGLRTAARQPKLVLVIWAWYGLLALVPALPAWAWWNAALGYSPEAAAALKRFGLGLFLDLTRSQGVSGFGLLLATTAAVAIVSAVSSAFVFGGILEVLGSEDDRRSFMHRFYRGCGHFFWRFLRLVVIAAVCLGLATTAVMALLSAVLSGSGSSEWEPAGYLAGFGTIAALAAVAGVFLLALDYTRIRVARDDSRKMLKAYFTGLAFVLRRLAATFGIALVLVGLLALLMAGYLAYETYAPAAASWAAILALFVVQQVTVLGRVFLRVALVGAERHFHLASLPMPAPVEAVEPQAPVEAVEPQAPVVDAPVVPADPDAEQASV